MLGAVGEINGCKISNVECAPGKQRIMANGRMLCMSQASDFVRATNGKISKLDALKRESANEISEGKWRFSDASLVKTQSVTGLNSPSEYHVKEI